MLWAILQVQNFLLETFWTPFGTFTNYERTCISLGRRSGADLGKLSVYIVCIACIPLKFEIRDSKIVSHVLLWSLDVGYEEYLSCMMRGENWKTPAGCEPHFIRKRSPTYSVDECRPAAQQAVCCSTGSMAECARFVVENCGKSYNMQAFINKVCEDLCWGYTY